MNTTSTKWLDPPLFLALVAAFLAGALLSFTFTSTFLLPLLGSISLPDAPPPWVASATLPAPTATSTETPIPLTPTETSTVTETQTPSLSPTPSLTFTPTLTASPSLTPTPTLTPSLTPTVTPLPTRTRPAPPPAAFVNGLVGHPMISSLDCEARAAVDWAGFFGKPIDEMDFLNKMPYSDNPEKGYVGRWWDQAGSIPPYSYGIHAKPIAEELRAYGLNAYAWKGIIFQDLQLEIAAGRPVMVWVIGPVQPARNGVEYTAASDGEKTIVAPFEHTVLLIGYDTGTVTIQDGGHAYTRTINDFLISWGTLGNMAVTGKDLK